MLATALSSFVLTQMLFVHPQDAALHHPRHLADERKFAHDAEAFFFP